MFPGRELTWDHIIPACRGGRRVKVNLVLSCKPCNNERGHVDFNLFRNWKREQLGLSPLPDLVFDRATALAAVKWLRADSTDTALPAGLRVDGAMHHKQKLVAVEEPNGDIRITRHVLTGKK